MSSYARRIRRAIQRGKNPGDITYKPGRWGAIAPVYARRDFTGVPTCSLYDYPVIAIPQKGAEDGK